MTRKHIGILILIFMTLLLCACGGKNKYVPFTPLSKVTVSPEREGAVQSALNGDETAYQNPQAPEPVLEPTPTTEELPTFDENSFFSEIDTGQKAKNDQDQIEQNPFIEEPTAIPEPAEPTPTPKPKKKKAQPTATESAPKPYDPNIMMYGTDSEGRTTYTLQAGEDLICIGRRFDISLKQLLQLNGLSAPGDAVTGTVITLPAEADPWSQMDGYGRRRLNPHPAIAKPRASDNLFSLACSFGDVLPEDIAVANQLVLGEPIPSGMQVSIP